MWVGVKSSKDAQVLLAQVSLLAPGPNRMSAKHRHQGTSSYIVASYSESSDVSRSTISDPIGISTVKVLKIVEADDHGINKLRRPHNVFKEVQLLNSLHHPNVSPESEAQLWPRMNTDRM